MERAKDQTLLRGSVLWKGSCPYGLPSSRGSASDLSSAKTIYGQENAEPGLIAVTACRDGF